MKIHSQSKPAAPHFNHFFCDHCDDVSPYPRCCGRPCRIVYDDPAPLTRKQIRADKRAADSATGLRRERPQTPDDETAHTLFAAMRAANA